MKILIAMGVAIGTLIICYGAAVNNGNPAFIVSMAIIMSAYMICLTIEK